MLAKMIYLILKHRVEEYITLIKKIILSFFSTVKLQKTLMPKGSYSKISHTFRRSDNSERSILHHLEVYHFTDRNSKDPSLLYIRLINLCSRDIGYHRGMNCPEVRDASCRFTSNAMKMT